MYTPETLDWLNSVIDDPRRMKIMELGDHTIVGNHAVDGDHTWAKDYWESAGAKHVCVDLRGRQDSAIRLDLSRPITVPGWAGLFHAVIDVGILTHLTDERGAPGSLCGIYECLRNMHTWCRDGGAMLHVLHSGKKVRFEFERAFVETLAWLNDYDIIQPFKRLRRGLVAFAVWKTGSKPFTTQADELLDTIGRRKTRRR